jgi:preprotein translocase subunit SecE
MAKSKGLRGFNRTGRNMGDAAAPATTIAAAEPAAPKKNINPMRFAQEVRAEARKVTWTSRKETWITSVMVFIMVALAVVFFAVVDLAMHTAMSYFIKIGS